MSVQTTGIDTNAILTLRLQREPEFKKVKTLFENCLKGKTKIYIPLPVLLEIEWVMRSFYKQSKETIIEFFEELLIIENVVVDDKENVKFSVNLYKQTQGISFTDCLIIKQVQSKNYELLTFDKKIEKVYHTLL